ASISLCSPRRGRTHGGVMEKGTMIGLGMAVIGVFVGAVLKGANVVMLFTTIPAILIVFVGSIGAVLVSFPVQDNPKAGKVLPVAMKGAPEHSATETIQQIVHLTNRARADGLLALEEEAKKIEDPFFRKGIELAVDGTDPEALKKTLNAEIAATKERHKVG